MGLMPGGTIDDAAALVPTEEIAALQPQTLLSPCPPTRPSKSNPRSYDGEFVQNQMEGHGLQNFEGGR